MYGDPAAREKEEKFVRALAATSPELERQLQEDAEYYGEILPHPFLSEVSRRVFGLVKRIAAGGPDSELARGELGAILEFLETTYAEGDEDLQELVAVSFLENVAYEDDKTAAGWLGGQLGTHLKQKLEAIESWKPPELPPLDAEGE
jgi:hypothetical protein